MELLGLITGPLIYFYGGAFFRWIFIYKLDKSFNEVLQNDKEKNRGLSRLILAVYVLIIILIISL